MRLQIASDLHLEHLEWRFPDYRGAEATDADVLVLAGDVASGTRALDLFARWPGEVVYVPGNHEYYGSTLDEIDRELRRRATGLAHFHVLNPGTRVIGGVRFVGCTLWTDYDVFGRERRREAMASCAVHLLDHTRISAGEGLAFTPAHALAAHQAQRSWLAAQLRLPFAGPTVVVTHHAPHPGSIHARYAQDPTSAGFASHLEECLGLAVLWIHGHTHDCFDYRAGTTRVLANPMGYCRGTRAAGDPAQLQRENPAFNPRKVIEIG